MPKIRTLMLAGIVAAFCGGSLLAEPGRTRDNECFENDNERRITGCTELLAKENLAPEVAALAYATRALAFSLKGQYDKAIPDYDRALRINPYFAVALNNRAWALYKSGKTDAGMTDIQRALALAPGSAHAHDTRAHIFHAQGKASQALSDYRQAMRFGGEEMVKLYQCGLQAHGLYSGAIDGHYSVDLGKALEACVENPRCDPLPADEECRKVTS